MTLHLEILVEEPSMETFLNSLLPKIPGLTFNIYPSQGKTDLLKNLSKKLNAYAKWIPAHYKILILVDRDRDDCHDLKKILEEHARNAGLKTKTTSPNDFQVINRVVIEELEAWFFGDWDAVRAAYPRVSDERRKTKQRKPDEIKNAWEALERILKKAGYFQGGLNKIEAARTIAAHMVPHQNTSPSFRIFWDALQGLTP